MTCYLLVIDHGGEGRGTYVCQTYLAAQQQMYEYVCEKWEEEGVRGWPSAETVKNMEDSIARYIKEVMGADTYTIEETVCYSEWSLCADCNKPTPTLDDRFRCEKCHDIAAMEAV